MVLGVGVDLVDIARFERALTRTPRLKQRLFGDIDLLDSEISAQSLAARFAAKEAALKALGATFLALAGTIFKCRVHGVSAPRWFSPVAPWPVPNRCWQVTIISPSLMTQAWRWPLW